MATTIRRLVQLGHDVINRGAMKTVKRVLQPERVRQMPEQFSWIDQALVQRHLIDRCDARAAALYLFWSRSPKRRA